MIHWDDTHDEQVKAMTDAELCSAFERTDGRPGNVEADALLAEIQRCNLDF
ncbi:hypothetical protein U1701_18460 [Sphingomonas sp. PB2P19]|uniref:hypothetical protein n=1 Tax=Sphingomonas rhamnosi TaxID=3096156 RepID=UPI002FC6F7C0